MPTPRAAGDGGDGLAAGLAGAGDGEGVVVDGDGPSAASALGGVPVVIAEKTTNIADLRGCGLGR